MTTKINAYYNGERYDALLETSELNHIHTVKLTIGEETAVGSGVTLFDAILQIRLIIEPAGWLLGVNASRNDSGNVFNVEGKYDDSVAALSGTTVKNLPALGDAPLESLSTVANQRTNFKNLQDSFIRNETSYTKDSKSKTLPSNNSRTVKDVKEKSFSSAVAAVVVVIGSIIYLPVAGYFIPTLVASDDMVTYFTWAALFGILIYGFGVAVAVDDLVNNKGSSMLIFAAISFPILSSIFSVYLFFYSLIASASQTNENILQNFF